MSLFGRLKTTKDILFADKDLRIASKNDKVHDVEALLHIGRAKVTAANEFGTTALMVAAESGNERCLQALLEHGAEPNVKNMFGNTALYFAGVHGNKRCVDILMAFGATVPENLVRRTAPAYSSTLYTNTTHPPSSPAANKLSLSVHCSSSLDTRFAPCVRKSVRV